MERQRLSKIGRQKLEKWITPDSVRDEGMDDGIKAENSEEA